MTDSGGQATDWQRWLRVVARALYAIAIPLL